MGWRFQKRVKHLPGAAVGIPGIGLSHTQIEAWAANSAGGGGGAAIAWIAIALSVLWWLLA